MTTDERLELIRTIVNDECGKVWETIHENVKRRLKEAAPDIRMNVSHAGYATFTRLGPKPVGPGRVNPSISTAHVALPIGMFEWKREGAAPSAERSRDTMKCEGNCEGRNNGHRGEIRHVVVYGVHAKPMGFLYCEQAIEEDRANGFTVDVIPEHLDLDSLPELTEEERAAMNSLGPDLVDRLLKEYGNAAD